MKNKEVLFKAPICFLNQAYSTLYVYEHYKRSAST
ncbi:MAG: hypothetical protein ACI9SY_000307 [Candidatus Paceibacteria bacterium]|jgi:hypothetical protein